MRQPAPIPLNLHGPSQSNDMQCSLYLGDSPPTFGLPNLVELFTREFYRLRFADLVD
jgi:hypothetical protein